nr:immunoglobulin light chain junction region [Macaca mulatta]
CQQYNNLPLTV